FTFFTMHSSPLSSTLFPYTTLFRSNAHAGEQAYFILPSDLNNKGGKQYEMSLKGIDGAGKQYSTQELVNSRKKAILDRFGAGFIDRKSTRLNSSHVSISYAVFCLKK